MKTTKGAPTWAAITLLLLLAFALWSCGGGASSGTTDQGGAEGAQSPAPEGRDVPVEPPSPGAGGEEYASSGGALPASAGSGEEAAMAQSSSAGQEAAPPASDFDRKIVKSAELGLRAEDVRESATEAQQVAARFGGSVLSSQLHRSEDTFSADLVLSIPSPEFEDALEELRRLGKEVTTDAVTGADVTEEFVDLESRERNLLAAEESLLRLYDRAQDVGDALSIDRELTNIRGQIEQVQGRIEYLENRTALSQVTLDIQPVAPPKPATAWSPARVAGEAWSASLAVLRAAATAVISAVVFGWWLLPVLVVAFVWWRRRNRGVSPGAAGSGP